MHEKGKCIKTMLLSSLVVSLLYVSVTDLLGKVGKMHQPFLAVSQMRMSGFIVKGFLVFTLCSQKNW